MGLSVWLNRAVKESLAVKGTRESLDYRLGPSQLTNICKLRFFNDRDVMVVLGTLDQLVHVDDKYFIRACHWSARLKRDCSTGRHWVAWDIWY